MTMNMVAVVAVTWMHLCATATVVPLISDDVLLFAWIAFVLGSLGSRHGVKDEQSEQRLQRNRPVYTIE